MDMKSSSQQRPSQGVVMLHESEPDLVSVDITDSNQESSTSHATIESKDPTFFRPQPPIRINIRTEVKRVPLTWDEVSAALSSDTRSKCWAGNEQEKKLAEAVVSV